MNNSKRSVSTWVSRAALAWGALGWIVVSYLLLSSGLPLRNARAQPIVDRKVSGYSPIGLVVSPPQGMGLKGLTAWPDLKHPAQQLLLTLCDVSQAVQVIAAPNGASVTPSIATPVELLTINSFASPPDNTVLYQDTPGHDAPLPIGGDDVIHIFITVPKPPPTC